MKSTTIQIRLQLEEKQAFEDAAELAGIGLSSWVRQCLRLAAIRELESAGRSPGHRWRAHPRRRPQTGEPRMVRPHKTPAEAIAELVKSGTKRWAEQRKAEERHARARANRDDRLVRFRKVTTKEVAYEVMPRAYVAASANGTLPANARQIYYAARGEILRRTGKDNLDSQARRTTSPRRPV